MSDSGVCGSLSRCIQRAALVMCLALPWVMPCHAVEVDGETLRDPTRPMGVTKRQASGPVAEPVYRLEGLIVAAGRRQALINGQLRSQGERFGRTTVVSIQADQVVLDVAGQKSVLRWKPSVAVRKIPVDSAARPAASYSGRDR